MREYLDLLDNVLKSGHKNLDRTGIGTRSLFGKQFRFDLSRGFPLITTKRMFFKGIVCELLWFLSGSTNAKELRQQGVHIWDEWAAEDGDLGPIYGKQWRNWNGIDQIAKLVKGLKEYPFSRRHIVNSWNVADLPKMTLPPCHILMQFYVCQGKLSCQVYQRSADIFLGVPFNIVSYALLTIMIAQVIDLKPGELIFSYGNLHLYENHVAQAKEQLSRKPLRPPSIVLNPSVRNLFSFSYEDIKLIDYDSHAPISAPIAI